MTSPFLGLAVTPDDDNPPPTSAPFRLDGGDLDDNGHPPARPDLPTPLDEQMDAAASAPFTPPAPLPMIATVPVAGVVLDAGQVVFDGVDPNGKRAVVGSTTTSRPGVLGIMLRQSAGAGFAYIMPDGQQDSTRPGFAIGTTFQLYPLKRAVLWLSGAATVEYAVLMADLPLNL